MFAVSDPEDEAAEASLAVTEQHWVRIDVTLSEFENLRQTHFMVNVRSLW